MAQWATGAVGRAALQELIENPHFQLVGVLVYDPAKDGLDAGALCGLPPTTGVPATTDKEAILSSGAQVVVHAASKAHTVETNAEDICRLLAAGIDVISTTSYNHLPTYGAATATAFEDACRTGNSHFHAAGENPGFMFERLVTTVTGLSKSIDRIDLYEATDVSGVDSRPMLIDLMGMGRPPADVTVDSPIIKKLDMAYRQALNATADVLGVELTHVDVSVDCTTLPHPIEVKAGVIEAGTVVGQRFSWVGHWSDRPLLAIHEEWVLTRDLPQWGLRPLTPGEKAPLIRAVIKGVPSFELNLDVGWEGEPPSGQHAMPGHLMIAMSAVRAIPYVRAQPPGVVSAPVFGALQLAADANSA
ncbi:dihydrodipicolinate synthase [Mycolicibacterium duvalii]|uniref:dihydrodipicolinate synthase n=1 Tax=Mycolicibacterium duvalii TaxID=39688 RepID=UPI000BEF0002|nr:dihydrodipicolinate synthase [Mycolicibacterium duvalii]MCV7369375.1 dihydrodipicolinate synthase [Mycolicibacterium duvalii]PEG40572.1 dihydrodipicolinate synthase [Mycolicibacterium duvalii]